jgi:hypothetical protein
VPHILRIACLVLICTLTLQCDSSRSATQVADLVAQVGQAKKQPTDASFQTGDVTIDRATKPSILARVPTRLTSHVTIPKHAVLRLAVAVHPSAWSEPTGAVTFMIGVADGHSYQTKATVVVDAFNRAADRRWHDITVSLEEFAGLTVDIVLNTRTGVEPGATGDRLMAVWGSPVVTLS